MNLIGKYSRRSIGGIAAAGLKSKAIGKLAFMAVITAVTACSAAAQYIETVNTVKKTEKPWQFRPGQSGNPAGRPKGSRNKLTEIFFDALYEDFNAYGSEAIARLRIENPVKYLQMVAAVVDKETSDQSEDDPMVNLWHAVSSGLVAKQIAEEQRQNKLLEGKAG